MDLTEQIARALAEVEHGEGAWEHLAGGWHTRYPALAQAVLPFITAERERCVAEITRVAAEASRCADDASTSPEYEKTGATMSIFAAMCNSMIAAIRSQP